MKSYVPILIAAFVAAASIGVVVSWLYPHTRAGFFSTPHPPIEAAGQNAAPRQQNSPHS